jgi:predicted unusual protein kinase regulating ubiquinone biosynthesis (AarF/ABC1/UbiB family)
MQVVQLQHGRAAPQLDLMVVLVVVLVLYRRVGPRYDLMEVLVQWLHGWARRDPVPVAVVQLLHGQAGPQWDLMVVLVQVAQAAAGVAGSTGLAMAAHQQLNVACSCVPGDRGVSL